MATIDNMVGRVLRKLKSVVGLPKERMPLRLEVSELVVDAIRYIQDVVPDDALKDLLKYTDYTMAGESYIDVPVEDILRVISLVAEESDGEWGHPWIQVSRQRFDEIRRLEDEADFDGTNTRIYTVRSIEDSRTSPHAAASHEGYDLYPTPVTDREVRLNYIIKAAESGNMTLPVFLHEAVVNKVVGEWSDRHLLMYERSIMGVKREYANKHNLSMAKGGVMRLSV